MACPWCCACYSPFTTYRSCYKQCKTMLKTWRNNFEWEGPDQQRLETRNVVFSWECLNIFATGCSSILYVFVSFRERWGVPCYEDMWNKILLLLTFTLAIFTMTSKPTEALAVEWSRCIDALHVWFMTTLPRIIGLAFINISWEIKETVFKNSFKEY